jgi:type 1 glutamine amidotransferase
MDTFNLATSTSPLTQANLDKYDVMVWYNVYRMYEHFDTATGNRIQRWYENGNKGLACIHQCVRSSNTAAGIKWNWWIDMMGKDYTDFAASGVTGPVFVDTEAVATIYPPGMVSAGQKFSWSDEWYIYAGNTRGTPGTKMMWTTADSLFTGSYKKTMGNDHPLVWIRNYGGGRFVLNSMYHTTALATSTGALRAFADSSFIGQLRFLAGYDGCTDPNYAEYNPKATHLATGACVNPSFIKVGSLDGREGIKVDAFKVVISQPGAHRVDVYSTLGSVVASRRGEGTGEYAFSEIRQPGVYYVRVQTAGMKVPLSRRIVLL